MMRLNWRKAFTVAAGVLASSLALAQEFGGEQAGGVGLVAIGSGLAMGLAALGGSLGQGNASNGALSGIARNPNSRGDVFMPFVLALALMEFQGIMGFLIAILWLYK